MDLILHIGAHRTASRSLQAYMKRQTVPLAEGQFGFWGPRRRQAGLHRYVYAEGRVFEAVSSHVQRRLDRARRFGFQRLVISDANMLGTVAHNMRTCLLYPDAADRMTRFAKMFGGQVTRVLLCPRSLDLYWCSALASGVRDGEPVPGRAALRRIAMARRGWRDVIADLRAAMPGVGLRILPFERYNGSPSRLLAMGLDIQMPPEGSHLPSNATPLLPELRRALNKSGTDGAVLPLGTGRWNPFLNDEHAALRELYADDMMWLAAGADGQAMLTEEDAQEGWGQTLPLRIKPEGRCDELQERRLARPG